MDWCQKGDIRSDKNIASNCNFALVQHCEIEVCVASFSNCYVCSEIKINRSLQIDIICAVWKKFIQNLLAQFFINFCGVIL